MWQRIFIVFAGPLANFLFAYGALMGLFAISGEQVMLPKIGAVIAGMPAESAGLMPNDLIQKIDGVEVKSWEQLTETIVSSGGDAMSLSVLNTDTEISRNIILTPELNERTNHFGETVSVPFAGISPASAYGTVNHGFIGGLERGFNRTNQYIGLTLQAFGKLITGSIGHENLGGPVMTVSYTHLTLPTTRYV